MFSFILVKMKDVRSVINFLEIKMSVVGDVFGSKTL